MGSTVSVAALSLAGICFWYFIAVVFGAPFLQSGRETLILGTVLSLTTVPLLALSVDSWPDFARIFFQHHCQTIVCFPSSLLIGLWNMVGLQWEYRVHHSCYAAILGAWLGAFPIPLDWDRWWQEWPITCVAGALLGFTLGLTILASAHFRLQNARKRRRKHKIV